MSNISNLQTITQEINISICTLTKYLAGCSDVIMN